MRSATGADAVAAYFTDVVLLDTGWTLLSTRQRWSRLDPPAAYWAVHRVRLGRDLSDGAGPGEWWEGWGKHLELRVVARGVFDSLIWEWYRDEVVGPLAASGFDPLSRLGWPVIFDETQHCLWAYPVDPRLSGLPGANDAAAVRGRLSAHTLDLLPGRIADVGITMLRYIPEVSATIRYNVAPATGEATTLMGKVQRSGDGAAAHRLLTSLHALSTASRGLLRVPIPVAYLPEFGLLLQQATQGEAVGPDRQSELFQKAAHAAAEAAAVLHDSRIEVAGSHPIEAEVERLAGVTEQFALLDPVCHELLRALVQHLRRRLEKVDEEEFVLNHGDLKYDQLLWDGEHFTLIDYEEIALAEAAWDLGKFCAHAVPSSPQSWEDAQASEDARAAFLSRYLQLRPGATVERFPIHEATHLALRAMVLMWGQSRGWAEAAGSLLALAHERLRTPPPH